MNFDNSAYDYKVSFGVVIDWHSLAWEHHVVFKNWNTAKEFIDLWYKQKENAVIQVKTHYNELRAEFLEEYHE